MEGPKSRAQYSPIDAIFGGLRKLFGAERIAGTLPASVALAAGLAVIPTALLLFNNRNAVAEVGPFYTAILATAITAVLAVIVLSRRIAPHVAGGLVGALGYGFYSLSWVPGSNQLPSLTFYWLLVSLPAAVVVVWLLSNSRLIVNLAATAAVAIATWLIITPVLADGVAESRSSLPTALALAEEPVRTPNIYLFVMDGFTNPRVTAEQFAGHGVDFDISDAIAQLEQRGFRHDQDATSNYGRTILSLPSTLNSEYPHTPEDPARVAEIWANGTQIIRGDNVLVNTLRSIGYDYWSASSGAWDPSRCDPQIADRCIGARGNSAEARRAVWWATPLRWQLGAADFRELPEPGSVVDSIVEARLTHDPQTPYIVVSHVLAPHQPYRYEADCSFRDSAAPGTTLEETITAEFRPLYANQASCVAESLIDAMDTLLAVDPNAMIFLQADHGTQFTSAEVPVRSVDWTPEFARERFGIFRMTLLPDECRIDDPRAQSVINTVPMVVSCVFGTEPNLLEPRYLTTNRSSNFGEVGEISPAVFE